MTVLSKYIFICNTGGPRGRLLSRFLGPGSCSRSPQIRHLKFHLVSLGTRQPSLFIFSPTCSCPLASSSSLGILSFLKSLLVSAKFKLYRQFAQNLLGFLRDKKSKNPNGIAFIYYTRITNIFIMAVYLPDIFSFFYFSDFPVP